MCKKIVITFLIFSQQWLSLKKRKKINTFNYPLKIYMFKFDNLNLLDCLFCANKEILVEIKNCLRARIVTFQKRYPSLEEKFFYNF